MPTPINISASRGCAILGLSKWNTPVEVWLQIMEARQPGFCAKNNYELPVIEDNAPMRWGKAFESAIIELAEGKRQVKIINRELFCDNRLELTEHITCHIDGEYDRDGIYGQFEPRILHEGKTASYFAWADNFGDPGTDRVPIEYQVQCQHQMICTGAEKVILSVLVFPRRPDEWEEMGIMPEEDTLEFYKPEEIEKREKSYSSTHIIEWARVLDQMGYFHQYEIPADPELQARMIDDYTDWWESHIIGDAVPVPQTYDDIKALLREPVGTIIAMRKYMCNKCNHEWETFKTETDCINCGIDFEDKDNFSILYDIESLAAERKDIMSEIKGTGPLAKRSDAIKVKILDYMRLHGADAVDDDSVDKMILRDSAGRKLGSYGKNKNGVLFYR